MEPYKIIPLHLKDSDFKHVLAWSKEERIYKNGSYEMLDLMESFTLDDAGKVKGFKQWVAVSHRWFAGRVWCGHGEWLHKRPWRMRYLARISAVDCCNHDIYGHCLCDCFCFATCRGGLRTCVYSAHSLQVFCLGWDLFYLEWRTPRKFRTSLICLAHGIPALLS